MSLSATEAARPQSPPDGGSTASLWRRAVYGATLVTMSALILWSRGFRAVTGDHHQYLLPVLRSSDPTFAVGDWFTEQTTPFHYAFQQGLALAERLDATTIALTAMHVATLATLVLAVGMLGRRLGAAWWMVPVVLFVLQFGVQRTWGDVSLIGRAALPHFAGLSLALLAIAATFGRRYGLAAGLLVATAYVHFSVGAWTGLVLVTMVVVEVVRGRADGRRALRPAVWAALALLPLVAVTAGSFVGPATAPETYRILFDLRSPHHYVFAEFGVANQLRAVAVIAIALTAEQLGRYSSRALRTAVLAITGIGLTGAFFLHVVFWPLPVRLFPYRLAPLLTGLAAILAVSLLARRDVARTARVFGGVAVVVLLVIERPGILDRLAGMGGARPAMTATAAAAVAAAVAYAGVLRSRAKGHCAPDITARWILPTVAVVTIGLTLHQPPTYLLGWFTPAEQAFGDAVREVVPEGEILVVAPDFEHARLTTGRGIVVDFKSFPMVGTEMQEWRLRLEDITGMRVEIDGPGGTELRRALSDHYRQQPPDAIRRAGERYGATYFVVHQDSVAGRRLLGDPTATFWQVADHVLAPIEEGGGS